MFKYKKGFLLTLLTGLTLLSSLSEADTSNVLRSYVGMSELSDRPVHISTNKYDYDTLVDLICNRRYNSEALAFNITSTLKSICEKISSQVKKTGQTISYYPKDDGDYQKGLTPHYERDDANEIVIDHVTKLQWQDDEAVKTDLVEGYYSAQHGSYLDSYEKIVKFFEITGDDPSSLDSEHHCIYLSLGGYHDWRLPTRKELLSIVDFGQANPAINPKFENVNLSTYWTSSIYGYNTDYRWIVHFDSGVEGVRQMRYWWSNQHSEKNYVRCVREGE